MTINVSANAIIDAVMARMDEAQQACSALPRGAYIGKTGPIRDAYNKYHAAEREINAITDVFWPSIPHAAIYEATRIARRWYSKTNWQKSLPESDASRLISYLTNQCVK